MEYLLDRVMLLGLFDIFTVVLCYRKTTFRINVISRNIPFLFFHQLTDVEKEG